MAMPMRKIAGVKLFNSVLIQHQIRQISSSSICSHGGKYGYQASKALAPPTIGDKRLFMQRIICVRWNSSATRGECSVISEDDRQRLSVFVHKLPWQTKKEDLMNLFPTAVNIDLPRHRDGHGTCKGIAFVRFQTVKEVHDALNSEQPLDIKGKNIQLKAVTLSDKDAEQKLYFYNLSHKACESTVKELFPEATEIFVRMAADNQPSGFGHLVFNSQSEANSAMERHQGVKIFDRFLYLKPYGKHRRATPAVVRDYTHRRPSEAYTPPDPDEIDVEALFIREDVQHLLLSITGFNHNKLFPKQTVKSWHTPVPEYKVLTEKELQKYERKTIRRGKHRLQMPPYLKETTVPTYTISEDPEIAHFSKHKYIFTDISRNKEPYKTLIVVRQINGVLRTVRRRERERMLQIFYPNRFKFMATPRLFNAENIQEKWNQRKYVYLLHRACMQFEPESSDFIQICHSTYEHVNKMKDYAELRSTRFFGPMTFYLIVHNKVTDLMIDMINKRLVDDAAQVVRLYHILHPRCNSAIVHEKSPITDSITLLKAFAQYEAKDESVHLKKAIADYLNPQTLKEEQKTEITESS